MPHPARQLYGLRAPGLLCGNTAGGAVGQGYQAGVVPPAFLVRDRRVSGCPVRIKAG